MAASELPEDQFTQDFRTQRRNYGDGDTRHGDHDRLWYDGRTKTIRVYDEDSAGNPIPGGTIIASADFISTGIDFSQYPTLDDLADAVEATFADSDYVSEAELAPYATQTWVTSQNYLTAHQDISGKANVATTLAGYGITDAYTQAQVNGFLASKSDTGHNHNDLYYLKTETYTRDEINALVVDSTENVTDVELAAALVPYATEAWVNTLFGDSTDHVSDADLANAVSGLASETYVDAAITNLIGDGADSTLDTLVEIANAISNNPDFDEVVNDKLSKTGGTMSGNIDMGDNSIININTLVFDGSVAGQDTTLSFVDPTASHTITFPNATGTVALTSNIPTNVSNFTNDSNYATQIWVESQLNQDSSEELQNWAEDSAGNLLPDADNAYDIGSPTQRVRELYVSSSSVHIGDYVLSESAGVLQWNGNAVAGDGSLHIDSHSITVNSAGVLELDGSAIATEAYVDALFGDSTDHVTDAELATALGNYYTQAEVDGLLLDSTAYIDQAELDAATAGLAPMAYVDASVPDLTPYATQDWVIAQVGDSTDHVTDAELTAALAGKANTATTLAGYGITDAYTRTEVDSAIDAVVMDSTEFVDHTELTTALGDYSTTAQMNLAIAAVVMDSTEFVDHTELNAGVADAKAYTDTEINNLIGGAPDALDTLNELAAAINDDSSYAAGIATQLAGKANTATTLAGYGITDAYTRTEVDSAIDAVTFADLSDKTDAYALTTVSQLDLEDENYHVTFVTNFSGSESDEEIKVDGNDSFVYNPATELLTVNNLQVDGNIQVDGSITATGTFTYAGTSEFNDITVSGTIHRTIAVTVAAKTGGGNAFYIGGEEAAVLQLQPGYTYRFDQSDNSNQNHPLRFSEIEDGTHNSGSEYTTGVTAIGTPGQAGAYTEITVDYTTPNLFYYCVNHSGMGSAAGAGAGLSESDVIAYADQRIQVASIQDLADVDGVGTVADGDILIYDDDNSKFGFINFDSTVLSYFTGYATESYVTTAIDNLIDSAPGTLDTLGELAAALEANDSSDDSTATWLQGLIDTNATAIAGKADTTYVDSEIAGIDTISADDTKVQVVDASAGGVIELHTAGTHRWTVTELGHLIPNGNALYDIGEAENKVRSLYLHNATITLGEGTLSQDVATKKLLWDNDGSSTEYSQQFVATEDYVDTQLGLKADALDNATQTWVNAQGYLTAHQDISGKADTATTLAGYGIADAYTQAEVNALIPASQDAVTLAGSYDYLTLSGQELTLNQIDPSTDIDRVYVGSGSWHNTYIGDSNSVGNTNTGSDNVTIGYEAGHAMSAASYNVLLGTQAGHDITTGDYNILIGSYAGDAITTGSENIAIGHSALTGYASTSQNRAIAIGYSALDSTGGSYSVAVGGFALSNDAGSGNTAIGQAAGYRNTSGINNIYIGNKAGGDSSHSWGGTGGDKTGNNGITIGTGTHASLTSGSRSIAVGGSAGKNITTGDDNLSLGYTAGDTTTTGSDNTVIGNYADTSSATAENETVIGRGATGNGDNTVTLGNGSVSSVHFGGNAGSQWMAFRETVPANSKGASGDIAGMVAMDADYMYYCYADYSTGTPDIWTREAWTKGTW